VKTRLAAIMLALLILAFFASCSEKEKEMSAERQEELYEKARELTGYLEERNEASAIAMMSPEMDAALRGKLLGIWDSLAADYGLGEYVGVGRYIAGYEKGYEICEMNLEYTEGTLIQRTVFNESGVVGGLFFRAGQIVGSGG